MATTEERLAALEAQMAALTATTPTTYYTHQYSGEEIDNAVSRALPNGAIDQAVGTFVRPNLLDNWYFGRPVNQRGQTEYAGSRYTIDRWRIGTDKNMALSISDDKLSIVTDTVDSYFNFDQTLETKILRVGATYTLSFLTDNYRNINQLYFSEGKSNFIFTDNLANMTFTVNSLISQNPYIGIQFKTNTTTSILAAKLELGSTQTLAHREGDKWVLNEVPDYGEQLRRCQRYFYRVNSHAYGWTYNNNIVNCLIPLPVTLRTSPVITLNVSGTINTVKGDASMASYEVKDVKSNGLTIDLYNFENAFTAGTPVVWQNFNIDISADL